MPLETFFVTKKRPSTRVGQFFGTKNLSNMVLEEFFAAKNLPNTHVRFFFRAEIFVQHAGWVFVTAWILGSKQMHQAFLDSKWCLPAFLPERMDSFACPPRCRSSV